MTVADLFRFLVRLRLAIHRMGVLQFDVFALGVCDLNLFIASLSHDVSPIVHDADLNRLRARASKNLAIDLDSRLARNWPNGGIGRRKCTQWAVRSGPRDRSNPPCMEAPAGARA